MSNNYSVEKKTYGYDVIDKNSDIVAEITDGIDITYYLSGCYNSGCDYKEIDVDALINIRNFCDMLIGFQ